VLRRARLQAIGQMAEEARRDLHLDENGSPFLRAVTGYVARSLKDDPDAALDPRALIAREVGRAPSANTAVNTVRGMIDVQRAVEGWFQRPAEAPEPEAWLTESDRIALIGLEFFLLSPTRIAAAIESGAPFAQQTADERIAVLAGVQASAFAQLVEAVGASEIDWSSPAPAAFLKRFEGTSLGYAPTLASLVQRSEDKAFQAKVQQVLSAETRIDLRSMAAVLERHEEKLDQIVSGQDASNAKQDEILALLRANLPAVQDQVGVSAEQAEGLLKEIATSGLPAEDFRSALFGGAAELKALGETLRAKSNLIAPDLAPLRQKASEAVDAGRLDDARAALMALSQAETDQAEAPMRGAAQAQSDLGRLERSVSRFRVAASHFASAASFLAPIDPPAAAAERNLQGIALCEHGERFPDPGALNDAVLACDAALEVFTRESAPSDWAMTQNNKANALQALGERAGGAQGQAFLEASVLACDAALEVFTRESTPSDWAMTSENKAEALLALAQHTGRGAAMAMLDEAEALCAGALDIYTPAMPYDMETATDLLARIRAARAALDGGG
jgi:hypothetical protein